MEVIQEVKGLEHLTLIEPLKATSKEFKPISKIGAVTLKRVRLGIYEIEDPSKIEIPKEGAYTLVYKLTQIGNNEIIASAIKFYKRI